MKLTIEELNVIMQKSINIDPDARGEKALQIIKNVYKEVKKC